MTFTYETMELAADEGLYLIVCGVAPGSRDADALNLLASWNATGNAENSDTQADLSSRSGRARATSRAYRKAPGHEPPRDGQQRLAASCAPPLTS